MTAKFEDPFTDVSEMVPAGATFGGKYQVGRRLGGGGMGVVFEATSGGRTFALKLLLPALVRDPDARARFHLEATVGSRLDCEHVVQVLDAGVDEASGIPFIAMPLLAGADVAHMLRGGPIAEERAFEWMAQLTRGLSAIHAAGVVHRDLKPENLFLAHGDRTAERVVLLDFGIAKLLHRGRDAVTVGLGTPIFMAPEQLHGRVAISPRTDLYSSAHVAFTMLTGRPYFMPEASQGLNVLLPALLSGLPEPATARAARSGVAIPSSFDAWFARATAPDPNARFASPDAQLEALGAALGRVAPMSLAETARSVSTVGEAPSEELPAPDVRPPFIGRPRLMDRLAAIVEGALDAKPALVVLTGPLGVGRSRVLDELGERCGKEFVSVLSIVGSAARPGPFQAIQAARALRGEAASFLDKARSAPDAARSIGWSPSDPVEPALAALLDWAEGGARLIMIDDAQELDESSLRLLSLLASTLPRETEAKLAIVLSVRDEVEARPEVRAFLDEVDRQSGTPAVVRLGLAPMSDDELTAIARASAPLDAELAGRLAQDAGGLPMFLLQPLRALHEAGRLRPSNGLYVLAAAHDEPVGVPSILDLLRVRLRFSSQQGPRPEAALPALERALGVLAFAEIAVPSETVIAVLEEGGSARVDAERAIDSLARTGLLRSDRGSCGLAQRAVAGALRAELGQRPWAIALRRALFTRLASVSGAGVSAIVARGFASLGMDDDARAHFLVAAEEALGRAELGSASELAEAAARPPVAPGPLARARLLQASATLDQGAASDALAILGSAPKSGIPPGLALEIRVLETRIAGRLGPLDPGRTADLVGDVDKGASGELPLLARLVAAERTRGAIGLAWVDEALAALARSPRPQLDLDYRLSNLRFELLWESRHGSSPECRAAAEIARDRALRLGSLRAIIDMELNLAAIDSDVGDHLSAERRLTAAITDARARGFAELDRRATASLAGLMLRQDRIDEATRLAARAVNASRRWGDTPLLLTAQGILAEALQRAGRLEEARVVVDEVIVEQTRANDPHLTLSLLRRADMLRASGDPGLGRADAVRALGRARDTGNADHEARARLWLALDEARSSGGRAMVKLAALVAELSSKRALWRPATIRALDEAEGIVNRG